MAAEPITVEALVCGHHDYSDSSRILHLFTRELGGLHALAKGLKKRPGDLARLDLLGHARLLVRAPGGAGSLYSVSGPVQTVESFPGFQTHLPRYACGAYAAELLMAVATPDEGDEELFDWALAFFARLHAASSGAELWALVRHFEVQALARTGLGLDAAAEKAPAGVRAVVEHLLESPMEAVGRLQVTQGQKREVERIIGGALDFHLGKKLKSQAFLREIL